MRLPPYSKYKPSGVEWLGEVPAHWEVDRLKWTTSGTVNGTWGEEPDGIHDLICVRVADFDRERFVVIGEPPTLRAVGNTHRKGRLLRKGDLLIEKSGGGEKQLVGCAVFFDHEFAAVCSNFVARMPIVPRHSARFWSYAHAALYNGRLNYPAIKQTTGIQNLDSAAYLDTRVGFPPQDDQHTIADFLDRETANIDTLVAKKRTLTERLKEKRTALISRTVTRGLPPDAARAAGLDPHPKLKPTGIDWLGEVPEHWEVKPLGRLVRFAGGATPDKGKPEYWDGDIPWVSPKDMKRMRIDDVPNHVSREGLSSSALTLMPALSVLIVVRGMILAHSFPVAITGAPVTINQDMKALTSGNRLNAEFLLWLLTGIAGIFVSLADESAHGTRKLESEIVARVRVALPSTDEQISIVDFLDHETARIDALVAKIETAIERLQEHRTALVTAAVTGKIDVRGTAVREEDAA